MTIEGRTASATRYAKDAVKYGIYPVVLLAARLGAAAVCGASQGGFQERLDPTVKRTADSVAGLLVGGLYAGLSTYFAVQEGHEFDANAREAVAADLGLRPDEVRYSDFKRTNLYSVLRRSDGFEKQQALRYVADGIGTAFAVAGPWAQTGHMPFFDGKNGAGDGQPHGKWGVGNEFWWDVLKDNRLVSYEALYGMFGLYWLVENYLTPKNGVYQASKVREAAARDLDIGFNDLYIMYQRVRTDRAWCQGKGDIKDMLAGIQEKEVVRPILEQVVSHFNHHDIYVPELVYMFNKMVDVPVLVNEPERTRESMQAVLDEVLEKGLSGIMEDHRRQRMEQGKITPASGFSPAKCSQARSAHGEGQCAPEQWVDRVKDRSILETALDNVWQNFVATKHPNEETLTQRITHYVP